MSVSNLAKKFKIDMNCTVKEYIYAKVIQRAKEKLLLGDLPVKEIGYNLGLNDEFYFSRFFKRETSLSRKDYKLNNKIN